MSICPVFILIGLLQNFGMVDRVIVNGGAYRDAFVEAFSSYLPEAKFIASSGTSRWTKRWVTPFFWGRMSER